MFWSETVLFLTEVRWLRYWTIITIKSMNRIGYRGTIFTQENFVRFDILTMPQCDFLTPLTIIQPSSTIFIKLKDIYDGPNTI